MSVSFCSLKNFVYKTITSTHYGVTFKMFSTSGFFIIALLVFRMIVYFKNISVVFFARCNIALHDAAYM